MQHAACCVQLAKYLAHYFDFIARTTDNGTCDNGHLRSLHGRIVAVINCMRLFWGRRVAAATGGSEGGGGGDAGGIAGAEGAVASGKRTLCAATL